MISLFVDATRKAESTRAEDRVRRVGIILANAIIEKGRANADEIEELMRVATESQRPGRGASGRTRANRG